MIDHPRKKLWGILPRLKVLQGAQNKALALGKDPQLPQKSLEEELQVSQ